MLLAQVLQAGLPQRGRAGQGVLPPGPSWRCLEAVSTLILAVLCRPEGQLSSFSTSLSATWQEDSGVPGPKRQPLIAALPAIFL